MIRVEVRNEYGLGAPELYKNEAATGDDPKALLEGVAVSGLVGILRQLGDLAEFAAEVFHGLQEAVTITSSRSHKLMSRVQRIEAALPPLEKAVLAQKSHLHFAYTAGSYWHPRIRCENNHFIYGDLPRFIMDSYEDCRRPPRLHFLDKFDPGGPGSCLKRYSDPTFFRRASGGYSEASVEKLKKNKKSRKIKKKKPWRTNGEFPRAASAASYSDRTYAPQNVDWQSSPSRLFATCDATSRPDQANRSNSLHLGNGSGDVDSVIYTSYSAQPEGQKIKESSCPSTKHLNGQLGDVDSISYSNYSAKPEGQESEESSSPSTKHLNGHLDYTFFDDSCRVAYDSNKIPHHSGIGMFTNSVPEASSQEEDTPITSYDTWDEKIERKRPSLEESDLGETLGTFPVNLEIKSMEERGVDFDIIATETVDQFDSRGISYDKKSEMERFGKHLSESEAVDSEIVHHIDFQLDDEYMHHSVSTGDHHYDIDSEADNYMDALNTIESESETDVDCQTKHEVELYSKPNEKAMDDAVDGTRLQHFDSHASNVGDDATASSPSKELFGHEISNGDSESHLAVQVNLNSKVMDDKIDGVRLQHSNSHAPKFNFDAANRASSSKEVFELKTTNREYGSHPAAKCNSDEATARKESNSITSECPAHLQSSQLATNEVNTFSLPDVDSWGNCHVLGGSDMEFSDHNLAPSKGREQLSVGCIREKVTTSEPQKHHPESSAVTSVQFWTNGGLLGLEPSKPPDFGVVNLAGQASVATVEETTDTPPKSRFEQQATDANKAQKSAQRMEDCSVSNSSVSNEDDGDGFSRWKIARRLPSADLDVRHQNNFGGSLSQSCSDNSVNKVSKIAMVASGDVDTSSKNDGNSLSRMFDIGSKLLVNGLHRELSIDRDGNSKPSSSLGTGIDEQNSPRSVAYRTYSGRTKDFSRNGSPMMSPSSSPPLGHMKISFQPVDGFESSKLRLRFPNGDNSHESCKDIFPTFQLIPELANPLPDINSDSDDDTFCRSSPYMSDDGLSLQSESNSELWESGESPAGKDHELYDALRRISLTESVETSLGTSGTTQVDSQNLYDLRFSCAEDGVGRSQSAHFFDLPSLETLNPSFKHESNDHFDGKSLLKSYSLKEPSPTPPPLPPMQWRTAKQQLEGLGGQQHCIPEAPSYAYDIKLSKSTISQQPKPAPVTQDQIIEAENTLNNKQPNGQTQNVQRENNLPEYWNRTDVKEDFLHQIRTKSFNLRRTVPTKPSAQTGLPSSVKVTAILEKANAIRQAVGSDDGDDDDKWSDN